MIVQYGSAQVELPDGDFWWANELEHETVDQSEEESVDGSLIIETVQLSLPRRISMEPSNQDGGWLPLSDWRTLRTWSNVRGATFSLTFANADAFTCIFARPAFQAKPVKGFSNRDPAEWWRGSVHFIVQG